VTVSYRKLAYTGHVRLILTNGVNK